LKKPRLRALSLPVPVAVAAVLSGVIMSLCFPPTSIGILVFVAMVPLLAMLQRGDYSPGQYFRAGYLFGAVHFLLVMRWILDLVPASSITFPWLMFPALLLLVVYLAVWPGLCFYALGKIARAARPAAVLAFPALWYFSEILRSSSEFAFPWAVSGYALADNVTLLQMVSAAGLFGMGLVIAFVNVLWSRALTAGGRPARLLFLAAGAVIVLALHLGGRSRIAHFDASAPLPGKTVAIAQPNVDLEVKWQPAFKDSTFRLFDRICRDIQPLDPALIVFPETAAPIYIRHDKQHRHKVAEMADRYGAQIYIGFLDGRYEGPDKTLHVYNSSGVFSPGDARGEFAQYDKVHLLPFGEAVPYAWKFEWLYKLDFGQANFRPGPWRPPLRTEAGAIAPMICFESIFPYLARRAVNEGAELLVNITNDGWFGESAGPVQHNAMAILRAVETDRYLVRSSNTGISMVVDPVGRVVTSLGLFEEGVIAAKVEPRSTRTPYARFGNMPVTVLAGLMLVGGLIWARKAGR
jgi:apolipoprotein N-acyltransferase